MINAVVRNIFKDGDAREETRKIVLPLDGATANDFLNFRHRVRGNAQKVDCYWDENGKKVDAEVKGFRYKTNRPDEELIADVGRGIAEGAGRDAMHSELRPFPEGAKFEYKHPFDKNQW